MSTVSGANGEGRGGEGGGGVGVGVGVKGSIEVATRVDVGGRGVVVVIKVGVLTKIEVGTMAVEVGSTTNKRLLLVAKSILETPILDSTRNAEVLGSTVDRDGVNSLVDIGPRVTEGEGEGVSINGTELVSSGGIVIVETDSERVRTVGCDVDGIEGAMMVGIPTELVSMTNVDKGGVWTVVGSD